MPKTALYIIDVNEKLHWMILPKSKLKIWGSKETLNAIRKNLELDTIVMP